MLACNSPAVHNEIYCERPIFRWRARCFLLNFFHPINPPPHTLRLFSYANTCTQHGGFFVCFFLSYSNGVRTQRPLIRTTSNFIGPKVLFESKSRLKVDISPYWRDVMGDLFLAFSNRFDTFMTVMVAPYKSTDWESFMSCFDLFGEKCQFTLPWNLIRRLLDILFRYRISIQ